MAKEDFSLSDEGTVDPVFGGDAAGLTDDGAKITLGETHSLGIVTNLVLFATMLVHKLNEAVEDGLFPRAGGCQIISLLIEQMVVVMHQGGYKIGGRGAMIVFLVDEVPKGVEDVAGGLLIYFRSGQLEVVHLTVKGRGKLTLCEGHGEVGKETNAHQFEIFRKVNGVDDGTWTKIDKCTCCQMTIYEIEVHITFTLSDYAQTMVIDDEGWYLLNYQSENHWVAMDHRQFVAKKNVLANL